MTAAANRARIVVLAMLAGVAAGCALTSKAAPLELRYFAPEPGSADPDPTSAAAGDHAGDPPGATRARLRLGRVTASAHLRYRIVRRASPVALDLYQTLRWTEQPDAFVRRSLSRALFDARPLDQAVGGPAPALDVEVTAFEDVVHADRHAGRVELRYQLHDERAVLGHGTITIDRDARSPDIEAVVTAIGQAMTTASAEVAARVTACLAARASP